MVAGLTRHRVCGPSFVVQPTTPEQAGVPLGSHHRSRQQNKCSVRGSARDVVEGAQTERLQFKNLHPKDPVLLSGRSFEDWTECELSYRP